MAKNKHRVNSETWYKITRMEIGKDGSKRQLRRLVGEAERIAWIDHTIVTNLAGGTRDDHIYGSFYELILGFAADACCCLAKRPIEGRDRGHWHMTCRCCGRVVIGNPPALIIFATNYSFGRLTHLSPCHTTIAGW